MLHTQAKPAKSERTEGIIFRPPIPIPRTVTFGEIPLGTTSQNKAAFVVWPPPLFGSATDTFNVSARIEGDPGPFRVVGMATADLVADPDAPGARSWEVNPTIDGAGPVSVDVGEAVLAIVEFDCPSDPLQDIFNSVVVLDGLPRKVTMPVVATTNAKLTCTIQIDKDTTLGIGETKAFPFSITSTLGHDAKAILEYDSTFSSAFSSSTISVDVPKGGTAGGFVTITNLSARSVVSHPYPVRFVVSETNGGHSSATTGLIIGARIEDNAPAVDIGLMNAAQELHQFWATNAGILTVGLPIGPVMRDANGAYQLPCGCGTLLQTQPDSKPQLVKQIFINDLSIVGCRCFASNDVHGDEAYLIASLGWTEQVQDGDTTKTVGKSMTVRTPIQDNTHGNQGSTPGDVIFSNLSLASNIPVGAQNVIFHVDAWDHEDGDPDQIRDSVSAAVQDALSVAAGVVTALLLNVGAGAAAGLVSKIAGLFSFIGDAIGSVVAAIFDEDHVGGKDIPIDSSYLQRLTGILINGEVFQRKDEDQGNDPDNLVDVGPPVQSKTSDSLLNPNRTYNFPELVEDDSPEGQSWLLAGDAAGAYRAFFNITASRLSDPHR